MKSSNLSSVFLHDGNRLQDRCDHNSKTGDLSRQLLRTLKPAELGERLVLLLWFVLLWFVFGGVLGSLYCFVVWFAGSFSVSPANVRDILV